MNSGRKGLGRGAILLVLGAFHAAASIVAEAQAPPVLNVEIMEVMTVSDSAVALPPIMIDVPEIIGVVDADGVQPSAFITVAEAITLADAAQALPPVVLNVAEAIGVTDASQALPPAVLDIAEAIGVVDADGVQPSAFITVAEAITLTDAAQAFPPVVLNVPEVIGVADAFQILPPVVIDVTEAITVADLSQALPPVVIDVAEAIVVADAFQALPAVILDVAEAIMVADVVGGEDTDGDGIPDFIDPDDDNDGIADEIDSEPKGISFDFSDGAQGGSTSGTILSFGDQTLTITDDANVSKGVRIKAESADAAPGTRTVITDFSDSAQGPLGLAPAGVAIGATGKFLVTDSVFSVSIPRRVPGPLSAIPLSSWNPSGWPSMLSATSWWPIRGRRLPKGLSSVSIPQLASGPS
jgi:hypothetical protein